MEGRFGRLADIGMTIGRAAHGVARAVFPHFCVGCRVEGGVLCADCGASAVAALQGSYLCPVCGERTAFGSPCERRTCSDSRLSRVISAGPYADPRLRALLAAWKYGGIREARDMLLPLFARFLEERKGALSALFGKATIVPVPMHPWRRAARGFNQAHGLAVIAARTLGLPMAAPLRRKFRFQRQAELEGDGRRGANARGSVTVSAPVGSGGDFVIVDDVYTTGATLHACAEALHTAGAAEVSVLTLLRG